MSTPTNDWYGGHRLGNGLFAESLVCVERHDRQADLAFSDRASRRCGITTCPARRCCATSRSTASRSRPWRRSRRPASRSSSIARPASRCGRSRSGRCRSRPCPASSTVADAALPDQAGAVRAAGFDRREPGRLHARASGRGQGDSQTSTTTARCSRRPPSAARSTCPAGPAERNWWGAAFDPDTGLFYIPSITAPIVVKLNKPDAARSNLDYVRGGPAFAGGLDGPKDLPLFKPPYGPHHGHQPEHGRARLDDSARRRPAQESQRDRRPATWARWAAAAADRC